MDPELYRAAKSGNWEEIKKFESHLGSQRTSNRDTVLHVVAQFCDSSNAVQQILLAKRSLLLQKNLQRETPLHIAARKGHSNVIRDLIDCEKIFNKRRSLLRSRNEDGNLALHEAVKNNCHDIVRFLVQEDQNLVYVTNNAKECPLYLAARMGYDRIVALILSTYGTDKTGTYLLLIKLIRDPSAGIRFFTSGCGLFGGSGAGPRGRTALHAAAIGKFPECVKVILQKLLHLTKVPDEFGWSALHYAARLNHKDIAKELLVADRSMAYIRTMANTTSVKSIVAESILGKREDNEKTALHVAVIQGHKQVIEEILSHCPDGWQAVTREGKNIIHLAVENEQTEVLDYIVGNSWASDLVNQKDLDGNTPLHLYAATTKLLGSKLVNHAGVDRNACNKVGLTPLDLIVNDTDQPAGRQDSIKNELERAGAALGLPNAVFLEKKAKVVEGYGAEMVARTAETYLIVATLIITVCFTVGFTIPGGYDSEKGPQKGMAVLVKKAAFVVFIATDITALYCSMYAVIILLELPDRKSRMLQSMQLQDCKLSIGGALVALLISFVAGLYVAVPNQLVRYYVFFIFLHCPYIFYFCFWPQVRRLLGR